MTFTKSFRSSVIVAMVAVAAVIIGYKYGTIRNKHTDKTKPVLTVAGIVYVSSENKFALIQRGKNPKGLAMFGGHVESKESPENAFIREAKEELNVDVTNLKLIGLHGQYGRDPRQHSVEGTYFCTTSQLPYAGSDAKSVVLYTVGEIQNRIRNDYKNFAFDHAQILKNFFAKEENKALYSNVATKK